MSFVRGIYTGTFGCTREVCGFRDALTGMLVICHNDPRWPTCYAEKVEFKDSGITIIGISQDPLPAINAFATKHNVTVRAYRFHCMYLLTKMIVSDAER
jgi:hypothetical protein